MRANTIWSLVGTACLALAVTPHTMHAQQSILLRYHPRAYTPVQTLTRSAIMVTILEGTGEAVDPDSITMEASSLESITRRLREVRDTQYVVDVSIDSTRARRRPIAGVWRDISDRGMRSARLVLDDRMRITEVEVTSTDTVATADSKFRGLAGGLELVFPEGPVAAGESWAADLVLPLKGLEGLDAETGFSGSAELIARSTVTVDSIIARAADMLVYLQVRGNFLPTALTEAPEVVDAVVNISGGFAGTLIWSTGWNAYVSGASRALVTLVTQIGVGELASAATTIRVDVTEQFQIRP